MPQGRDADSFDQVMSLARLDFAEAVAFVLAVTVGCGEEPEGALGQYEVGTVGVGGLAGDRGYGLGGIVRRERAGWPSVIAQTIGVSLLGCRMWRGAA